MSPEAIVEALDQHIFRAEEQFEAEKHELMEAAHASATLVTRRAYLKSIETSLAELHECRQHLSRPAVSSDVT